MARKRIQRNEELYQKWLEGEPIKALRAKFGITRQRIYQILKSRGVANREKTLRMVNKLSR